MIRWTAVATINATVDPSKQSCAAEDLVAKRMQVDTLRLGSATAVEEAEHIRHRLSHTASGRRDPYFSYDYILYSTHDFYFLFFCNYNTV